MRPLITSVAAVLAATLTPPAGAIDLVLRQRLAPAGPVIRLGDIATVLRATPAEAARLSALPLMPAPAPGAQQVVRGQQVRDLLVAHGVDLMDVRFDGATRVVVGEEASPAPVPAGPGAPPPGRTRSAARRTRQQVGFRLVTESREEPTQRSPTRPRRAYVSPAQSQRLQQSLTEAIDQFLDTESDAPALRCYDVSVPPRNLQALRAATGPIGVTTTDPVSPGPQRFLISFPTSGGPVRFPVTAGVGRASLVVAAAGPIARGELITAANTKLRALAPGAVSASGATPLETLESALGREAARPIRPDQTLTDRNSLPPLMVRRGDLVDVRAGSGGVSVRVKAKARSDGRRGEVIEVETIDNRRRLEARVTGYGRLAVLAARPSASSRGARR